MKPSNDDILADSEPGASVDGLDGGKTTEVVYPQSVKRRRGRPRKVVAETLAPPVEPEEADEPQGPTLTQSGQFQAPEPEAEPKRFGWLLRQR